MRDKIRAAIKLFFIVLWLSSMYGALWVAMFLRKKLWRDRLICICNHGLLVIIGIRLKVTGELSKVRPLLVVTNHVSYLDIILIAACSTVRFTPKSEIGAWFFIGGFSRLGGSVFIDRRAEKVAEMKQRLHDSLAGDDVICLFPEATTGNGVAVKEFKSGFFNLAREDFGDRKLFVQPAAVVYTHIAGLPIDRFQWPAIAWYGDMELMSHLWHLLMLPAISAEIVFLPAIDTEGHSDRKKLAAECQMAISSSIQAVRKQPISGTNQKTKAFNPSSLRKK